MKISDLKANASNPRKISAAQKNALKKSLLEFGDLSGIVYNARDNSLVAGHQRKSVFTDGTIKILEKFDPPTKTGTIAIGYIEFEGERHSFRKVDWDKKKAMTALLSANKSGGEWDNELLRLNFSDFPDLNLELTGFSLDEMDDLGIDIAPLSLSDALGNAFDELDKKDQGETDSQYVKNNPGPDSEADRENLPDLLNRTYPPKDGPEDITDIDPSTHSEGEEGQESDPFKEAGKETTVQRRNVIIIDCDSDEIKKALKEKISPMVNEANAKFF